MTDPGAVRARGGPVEAASWTNETVYVCSISRRNFTTYNTFRLSGRAGV